VRFEHALQAVRSLGAGTADTHLADAAVRAPERAKWRLWQGRWPGCRRKLAALGRWVSMPVEISPEAPVENSPLRCRRVCIDDAATVLEAVNRHRMWVDGSELPGGEAVVALSSSRGRSVPPKALWKVNAL
jgi:hypothetical protein